MTEYHPKSIDADLVELIGQLLSRDGGSLVTAESCTGGGIAQSITAVSGVSDWFCGGFVTYSNQAKMTLLGVDRRALEEHGAVSQRVVEQMATGALQTTGATIAVAVSGIAGPGGGTSEKPVGTVWIAWALKGHCESKKWHFSGDREQVRAAAVSAALRGVAELLSKS